MAFYCPDLNAASEGYSWSDDVTLNAPFPGGMTQINAGTKISQTISSFDGTRFAIRGFDGAAWSEWFELSAVPAPSSGWPSASDIWLWNDECEATTGWSLVSGAGLTAVSSQLVLPAGSPCVRAQKPMTVPASGDYIIYLKARYGMAAGAYNQIAFRNASSAIVFALSMGYNYAASVAQMGCLSASVGAGASKVVLRSSVDYSAGVDLAIHVDSTFNCISFYERTEDGWNFLNSASRPSTAYSISRADLLNTSGLQEMAVDFISVARPAIMAIGDSTTAGSRGFSPNPATWSGVDDYASCWMKTATIFEELRNNLIVNKGVGGNTSAQIKARIAADVVAHGPQVAFVQASCNDYHNGITSHSARTQNIQDSVDLVAASGASVILLNAVYANSNNAYYPAEPDFNRDWWENHSPSITSVSMRINPMDFLSGPDGYIDPALCDPDGIHPLVAGYAGYGQLIKAAEA